MDYHKAVVRYFSQEIIVPSASAVATAWSNCCFEITLIQLKSTRQCPFQEHPLKRSPWIQAIEKRDFCKRDGRLTIELSPAASRKQLKTMHDEAEIEREIRFAVVIYGGVSLTVYINGIVQEMLNMVRSTAKSAGAGNVPLTPLQRVYRELAHVVGEPAAHSPEARPRPASARAAGGSGDLAARGQQTTRQLRPGRAALRADATKTIRQLSANEAISRAGRRRAADLHPLRRRHSFRDLGGRHQCDLPRQGARQQPESR